MGAALSIFVILSLSVFVVRVASVALRFTGLTDSSARFQALSAFTGTGFTTSEAEMVVNYPVRRRIIGILMIIGNMGFVTVFATLVVSLVQTDGEVGAVVTQITWLVGGMAMLWVFMLNDKADRFLCSSIGKILESTTFLGKRSFHRLLQLGDGYSVCEHKISPSLLMADGKINDDAVRSLNLTPLAIRSPNGKRSIPAGTPTTPSADDTIVLFGPDTAHDALGSESAQT
jgi:hypothetical protein